MRLSRPLSVPIGGEEFLIVLTDCRPDDVFEAVDRLRRFIADNPIAAGSIDCPVTMSFGTATVIPGAGMQSEDLLKRADDALYQAKNSGRNRVMASTG